jgi:hypothetical protein
VPLPLDEIEARLGHWLLLEWLRRVGWSLDDLASMYAHGVPADWAAEIAAITKGAVTVDDWPRLLPKPRGLHDEGERAIVRSVNQADLAQVHKKRRYGRPIESKHPFAQALKTKGLTVKEWADMHPPLTRSRVKSWMLDGEGGRAIPREYAETIRRELHVPLTAWKHGIKD